MIYLLEAAIWTLFVSRSDATNHSELPGNTTRDTIDFVFQSDSADDIPEAPKNERERISRFHFPGELKQSLDEPSLSLIKTVFGEEAPKILNHKPGTIEFFKGKVNLGNGHFGNVDLCLIPSAEKGKLTIVAQKHLNPDLLDESDDLGCDSDVCKKLMLQNHDNVPTIYDVIYEERRDSGDDDNPLKQAISMEPCLGGTLYELINKSSDSAPEEPEKKVSALYLLQVMEDIANGFAYLKEEKILYSDIKPDNILLGLDGVAKIADFGFSRLDEDINGNVTGRGKSPNAHTMSPEMVSGHEYGHSSVIYGAGILFHRLCTNQYTHTEYMNLHGGHFVNPYKILSDDSKDYFVECFRERTGIAEKELDERLLGLLTELFKLLQSMVRVDQRIRPSIEEVVNALREIKTKLTMNTIIRDIEHTKKLSIEEVVTVVTVLKGITACRKELVSNSGNRRVPMDEHIRAPKIAEAQKMLKALFDYSPESSPQDSRRRLMQRLLETENRMRA